MIGRIVFFATHSVVGAMFPIVAQKHERGEPHRYLLWISLTLVGVVSGAIIVFSILAPELIINVLFGEAYLSGAPLLWIYAVSTALFALANVLINYQLSTGRGRGSLLVVITGFAQVIGLWLFHETLAQVIWVQVYIMSVLLILLFGGELYSILQSQVPARAEEPL